MNTYTGGIGSREGGDLIRWQLDINEHLRSVETYGVNRTMIVRERAPEATLTLHDITRDECIEVIALINNLRSGANEPAPELRAPSIADRFRGLEFD